MLMELFQRLFGASRDVTPPYFDAGNRAVEISVTILRECINLGFAGHDGPNRRRLAKPFARGYLFGFSDACIQRFGVLDELEALALITVVHVRILGHKIGSLLVGDALRDQHNAEFRRGQIAGAEDLLRWLNDRSYTPLLLSRFLQADDATSCPMVPTGILPADSDIESTNVPAMHAPSTRNPVHAKKKTLVEAAAGETATIIRLGTGLKTIKPVKRDEH